MCNAVSIAGLGAGHLDFDITTDMTWSSREEEKEEVCVAGRLLRDGLMALFWLPSTRGI